jgi:iron complex outermembrane recepter protein
MTTSKRRLTPVLAAAIGAVLAGEPAWADSQDLGEVVVTARKRDESFRDVPVTINVFTEQAIQSAGVEKPGDFIAMVPNMQLVEVQNAGTSFVVVRGISQARNSEPSVAVLVDGVLESSPAQFNQGLNDIQQIEVLKGPQGALYGRSAIGGAILIKTREPGDQTEGQAMLGYGNGNSSRAQLAVGGPIDDAKTMKYRASLNFSNTDGLLENRYLNQKADPARDYSGRVRFAWKPNDSFSGDLRIAYDRLETRGFYYEIPRSDEANAFTTFSTPADANNTSTPIMVNNPGENNRDLFNVSLKLDFKTAAGVLSLTSAYDKTKEIITGDAWDFRPIASSILFTLFGSDQNQSQFLDVKAYSQEVRFTAKPIGAFSWIAGAYYVHTDRFISTANMYDTGAGVFPVYETPRANPLNPIATFLADTQSNDAWAVFADATYEVTPKFEIDVAARYDEDARKNTTDTPDAYIKAVDPTAYQGEVRKHTWSELQPKGTLRYKATDSLTFYGGWSRGFRSGGFNQTGVGAAAAASKLYGVGDLFNAEVAETWEVGMKSSWLDHRLNVGVALYDTKSTNGYFFVYIPANGTQNLGNLDATYKGGELEINAKLTDNFDMYASFGYTDSHIDHSLAGWTPAAALPAVVGNQAPVVSRTTVNAGIQYHQPVGNGLNAVARLDYQQIGRTWWEPYNVTSRDPVNLVDARFGVDAKRWAVTAWAKNLTNEKYNTEFSPGPVFGASGFLWKAQPRRYGLEYRYRF